MTCRSTLLFGLIATLSFVPCASRGADSTPQRVVRTTGGQNDDAIVRQASARVTQYTITSDDWQRSRRQASDDLRFTKPKIPSSNPAATQPTTATAHPTQISQPDDIKRQPTQHTAIRRIEATRSSLLDDASCQEPAPPAGAAIIVISDAANDRERAYAAVARLKQLIDQPEAEAAIAISQEQPQAEAATNTTYEQPVETQSVNHASTGAIRSTIEQLRLFARRLTGRAGPTQPRERRDWRLDREQSGDGLTW
jgi:hypothetical protein